MPASLIVDLDLDTKKAEEKARTGLGKAGKEAGRSFSIGFASAIKVGVALVAFRAVSSALGAIKRETLASVDAAKNLEVFRTQFATILGSTKAAQKQLSDLQKFAATTPFQLPGLATATRQLLSFGVEQEKIIPTLRTIGELAAGTGTAIEDLTIPYGRLISTQKLTLIELDKFADRGVNLYGRLSEQTGISLKTIRDDISKGKVDFKEFTRALSDLTSEGGTFFGATVAQSKTLSGLFSTLNDNIFNLRAAVGSTLEPILKAITVDLIGGVQKLTTEFAKSSDSIINSIFNLARSATFIIDPFTIAFNFIFAGFKALETGIAAVAAGILTGLQKTLAPGLAQISKFPGVIGDKAKSALAGLNGFAEASQNVLAENAAQTEEALLGIFETGMLDEKLRNAIERYRQVGEEAAKTFSNLSKSADDSSKKVAGTANNLGKSLNNSLGNAVAGGIEKVAKALVAGENVFKAFGQAALGFVADFAIQTGKLFVATGIAELALFKTPGAAIAAGAALIAAGTIAKSFFGGESGGDAGGVAGISSGGPLATQPEFSAPTQEEREEPETRVSVTIQGDVFDSEETGLRLSKILESASLNDNVRIFGGIA